MTASPRPNTTLILVCILVLSACDSGSETTNATPTHSGGYKAPKFDFQPGEPGRAVGLRAVVELDAQTLETQEVEVALLDARTTHEDEPSNADAQPTTENIGIASQALCSTDLGQTPAEFETYSGRVCWLAVGIAGGAFGAGGSVSRMVLFTREGRYRALAGSEDIYVPPDITNFGDTVGVGCLMAAEDSNISLKYLNDLAALSFSASLSGSIPIGVGPSLSIGESAGFSIFTEGVGHGFAKAFQYDTTLKGASVGLIPLPVSVRYEINSGFTSLPVLISKSADRCGSSEESPFATQVEGNTDGDSYTEAAYEFLDPLLDHLSDQAGFGPGPHTMAGTNADAFDSLGGSGLSASKDFPAATLDDLVSGLSNDVDTLESDAEIAAAGGQRVSELANILPSPTQLDGLMRNAAVGVVLLHEADNRDEYGWGALQRIEVRAGEPVELVIEASEIAAMLGVPSEAAIGALLTVSASHTLSPSDHELSDTSLVLTFTPQSTAPLLLFIEANLENAVGPLTDEQRAATLKLTPRLVVPIAGPAMQVEVTSVARVASGGSITLNAILRDESGNVSDTPAEVSFFDGNGELLGSARATHGVASLQYVPSPSSPSIDRVERATLTRNDGAELEGIEITGSGFSGDADVLVDGRKLDPSGDDYAVVSSGRILVAIVPQAATEFVVRNPGGKQATIVFDG